MATQTHKSGELDHFFEKTRNRVDYNEQCRLLDSVAIGDSISFPFGKNQTKLVREQFAKRGIEPDVYKIASVTLSGVSCVAVKKLKDFTWTPVEATRKATAPSAS